MGADFHNILFISILVTILAMAITYNSFHAHCIAERCSYLVDATIKIKLNGSSNNKGTFIAFLKVNLFDNNVDNMLQKIITKNLKILNFTQQLLTILLLGISIRIYYFATILGKSKT